MQGTSRVVLKPQFPDKFLVANAKKPVLFVPAICGASCKTANLRFGLVLSRLCSFLPCGLQNMHFSAVALTKLKFCKSLCVLTVYLLMSCHTAPKPQEEAVLAPVASTVAIINDLEAQHRIFLAFAQAYPNIISDVEFLNDDWTMLVNGVRFYFARGRFLPEELRGKWENYYPYDFYAYPWTGTAGERRAAFDHPVYSIGSSFLFDTLYSSPTEDESWELQEKYSFLGVKLLIHPNIRPLLDRVSDRVRIAAQADPSITEWIAELRTSPPSLGWNWRNIAGSNRRSNHSYGTAIDLLPRDLRGRHTYWQWSINDFDFENYYMPPDAVIKAFEDHGFIWGGNWDLIDTMHFEYRPEILLLNGFVVEHLNR